jgi:hypothetical protein
LTSGNCVKGDAMKKYEQKELMNYQQYTVKDLQEEDAKIIMNKVKSNNFSTNEGKKDFIRGVSCVLSVLLVIAFLVMLFLFYPKGW